MRRWGRGWGWGGRRRRRRHRVLVGEGDRLHGKECPERSREPDGRMSGGNGSTSAGTQSLIVSQPLCYMGSGPRTVPVEGQSSMGMCRERDREMETHHGHRSELPVMHSVELVRLIVLSDVSHERSSDLGAEVGSRARLGFRGGGHRC